MRRTSTTRGFSLLETLIALGAATLVIFVVTALQMDTIRLDATLRGGFAAQDDARRAFRVMTQEMRVANYADHGSYPITSAMPNAFSFFADTDGDGSLERVRYFLDGTTLRRGVIVPTGVPAVYDPATEVITALATDVTNGATPVFAYFDETYTGTSEPLVSPFFISDIRLVRMTLIIDKNGDRPPGPQTSVTQVMLRNLKDNL